MGLAALFTPGPLREKRCLSCALPVPFPAWKENFDLCAPCLKELTRRSGGFCRSCGNILASREAFGPCGNCISSPRPWRRFFFHAEYRGLLRELLLRLKNHEELALAPVLGGLIAAHPELSGPYDLLIPLPLHDKRLQFRGFNQAQELARPLAQKLGIALESVLLRDVDSLPQAGLHIKERQNNVRGIFRVQGDISGANVLLFDDIATTCSSLESAAACLLKAGVASLDVAVVGRTAFC